jgi:DNA polymerase-1
VTTLSADTTVTAPPRGGPLDAVQLHHVVSLAELDDCRRWLSGQLDGQLCADTESAGLNPHRDAHRMTQIGDKRHGWSFPPEWMGAAHELLASYAGRIGFFNAPYDIRVFGHQSGLWLNWAQVDDAQLVLHLIDSAAVNKLKPRAARDIDPSAMAGEKALAEAFRAQGWGYATVPDNLPAYWMYGALDPVLVSWLLDKHLPMVRSRWAASYDLELAYNRLCAKMMSAGMMIDRPYIEHWAAVIGQWHEQAAAWLRANWGVTEVASNAQIGRALEAAGVPIGPRTATGLPKADKDTMDWYAAHHPWAAPLINALRYAKKAEGIQGRYLQKFLAMAVGDIMHYSIHSIGAQRTGRNSVTDPPMQTFDRDVPIARGCFIPRPGNAFGTIDADQIEARLAAHTSGDPQMIADFLECDRTGASFFLRMASRIYHQDISKKDPRYTMTKNTVYATIYGSGMETAAATAGVPIEQLRPIYDGFRAMYPQLARRSRRLIESMKRMKGQPRVKTISGRELAVDRHRAYSAVDYEIQGSAAEILKAGAVAVAAAGYEDLLRITIHDELMLEGPREEMPAVMAHVEQILTDRDNFRVPLTWSGSVLEGRWVKT